MARNPRRLTALAGLLGVLLAVLIASITYRQTAGQAPPASNSAARRSPADPNRDMELKPPDAVTVDALNRPRPLLRDGERNPFRFTPRVTSSTRPAPTGGGPTGSGTSAPVTPTSPPGPPPIPLKFIGIVDAPLQGGKLAVLSDGRSVLYGHEGDVIDGRFKIVRIGVESIEMAYLDGRGRQTIRLTGQ